MHRIKIIPGGYYHLYNRGNNKQDIFFNNEDRERFLFLILYLQSPLTVDKIGRKIGDFLSGQHPVLPSLVDKIVQNRYVELISFILMPNHFHLTIRETKEKGISTYMQRVLNAYTKYSNTKYQKTGHLFQGPFQTVPVTNNNQLLYLSTYIHLNCRELKGWAAKEHLYPWSSYQDYSGHNRWGKLLKPDIITKQFKTPAEYRNFVKTSMAKSHTAGRELLIDE